jgi:sulfofructose kinase
MSEAYNEKIFDVAGLGQCSLDYLCSVPRYPTADQKCEFSNLTIQGGGPVATAMVALSRLGCSTAFLGKTGADLAGREIQKGLKQEKVCIRGLIKARNRSSQNAFIVIENQTANRTIFWNRGDAFPLQPGEITWDILDASKMLHLDGLHIEASLEAARFARSRSIPVMLDAGTLREEIRPLLPLIDYLIVSENFAKSYGHGENPLEWLSALALTGARITCITMGNRGSIALEGHAVFQQKAFSIEAVDTTGCGDAFHGGFLYGILRNWPLRQTQEFAAAVAALKCRKSGGRDGLPTLEETMSFLRERGSLFYH